MCMRYVAFGVDDVMQRSPMPAVVRIMVTMDAQRSPFLSINHVKNGVPEDGNYSLQRILRHNWV